MLLLLLPLFLAAQSQEPPKATPDKQGTNAKPVQLDGIWAITWNPVKSDGQAIPAFYSEFSRKKVVVFKSVFKPGGTGVPASYPSSAETDVQVSDPETNTICAGKAHDFTKFSFCLPMKTEYPGYKAVTWDGSRSGNTIYGRGQIEMIGVSDRAKIDKFDVEWSAVKLPSVWECANHKNPSHIATTDEEIRSLTMQYKCEGWHKLKTN